MNDNDVRMIPPQKRKDRISKRIMVSEEVMEHISEVLASDGFHSVGELLEKYYELGGIKEMGKEHQEQCVVFHMRSLLGHVNCIERNIEKDKHINELCKGVREICLLSNY